MIYTVTLNPACDKTVTIEHFQVNKVNRIAASRQDPGGKSINVSKVIGVLGGESIATGILGGSTGRYIAGALEEMGIRQEFVWVEAPTRTNLKVVDPADGTYTDINDSGEPVEGGIIDRVLNLLLNRAQPGDITVLAGKLPKGAPEDTYAQWVMRLQERGVATYVDAEGEALRLAVKAAPQLIKPNEKELADLAGSPCDTVEEMAKNARKLLGQGVGAVIVSMGGEGAMCFSQEGCWRARGLHVPVRSTVGAGDSMMAALAFGAQQGLSMEQRFRLAMAVSAAKVMVSGSQPPQKQTIDALLEQVVLEKI